MTSAKDWEEPTFVTPPITRIPIKTNLSNVLLMSNPWEQRDLDKKLAHIAKERERREKVLEWNQRHFFVTKIFDADYNLRFTQDLQQYSDKLKEENERKKTKGKRRKSRSVNREADILVVEKPSTESAGDPTTPPQNCATGEEEEEGDELEETKMDVLKPVFSRSPDRSTAPESVEIIEYDRNSQVGANGQEELRLPMIPKAQGSGIFLPARKNKVRKSPRRKPKQTPVPVKRKSVPARENTEDDSALGSVLPHINRSQTLINHTLHQNILTGPVMLRSPSFVEHTGDDEDAEEEAQKEALKSISLPQIPVPVDVSHNYRYTTGHQPGEQDETFITKHPDTGVRSSESPTSSGASDVDNGAGSLISDITSRLPMSLMIKANQNVNNVVFRRKRRWIEKAKRINQSQVDLLSDPRYIKLRKALVNVESEKM